MHFLFDPGTGAFTGWRKINRTFELSQDGQSLTGSANVTTYNAAGNVTETFVAQMAAQRMQELAPAAALSGWERTERGRPAGRRPRTGNSRRTRLHWNEPEPERPRALAASNALARCMDELLTVTDSAAALLEGPDPGAANGARPASSSAMVVFEDVGKVYDPDVVALDGASFVIEKGDFVFVVGPSGSEVDDHQAPAQGARADVGADHGRRARPDAPQAVEGAAAPAQPRLRLPGLRCCATGRPSRTSHTHCACRASRRPRSGARCRKCWRWSASPTRQARGRTSSRAVSSSASRSRAVVVNHPPLLICDEPTGNLDPDTSVGIMQLLHRINTAGTTILMVTHDREMVDKMRKRVIALDGGKVVRDERRGGYETE